MVSISTPASPTEKLNEKEKKQNHRNGVERNIEGTIILHFGDFGRSVKEKKLGWAAIRISGIISVICIFNYNYITGKKIGLKLYKTNFKKYLK